MRSLFDMKSAPELIFGLSCRQISKISISDILENLNETGLLSGRKLSKFTSEFSISDASLGPIPVKKVLNPFAIYPDIQKLFHHFHGKNQEFDLFVFLCQLLP